MMSGEIALPSPPLTWRITIAPTDDAAAALAALPAGAGVFAIKDQAGGTLCLAVTANLRRQCRAKLQQLRASPSNSIDGAPSNTAPQCTLMVLACTVGSAFEADWAYLQLARMFMPHSYGSLLDRWRGWFVHCNPQAPFPQFIKTQAPGAAPTGRAGTYFGPMSDKHAAQRFIEAIVSTFDLCRYHHILVQAPHGNACAYKEMGRCPAPCDGTVSMDHYHRQVQAALRCAAAPATWHAGTERAMARASDERDFEAAARFKRMLDDAADLMRAEFRHVRPLDHFRFIAVMPSESLNCARIFMIDRGWIAPLFDLAFDTPVDEIARSLEDSAWCRESNWRFNYQRDAIENIGLVSWYLSRTGATGPAAGARSAIGADFQVKRKAKPKGDFIAVADTPDAAVIERALRRLKSAASDQVELDQQLGEQSIDHAVP